MESNCIRHAKCWPWYPCNINNLYIFWRNILHTESVVLEKDPEFSAESLCLRQGMVTSGRWCHMTLLDHVTPVGGWQLRCPGRCPCSAQASLAEGREILLKIRELFHHNLTLCAECFIRNYVSRAKKHSLSFLIFVLLVKPWVPKFTLTPFWISIFPPRPPRPR